MMQFTESLARSSLYSGAKVSPNCSFYKKGVTLLDERKMNPINFVHPIYERKAGLDDLKQYIIDLDTEYSKNYGNVKPSWQFTEYTIPTLNGTLKKVFSAFTRKDTDAEKSNLPRGMLMGDDGEFFSAFLPKMSSVEKIVLAERNYISVKYSGSLFHAILYSDGSATIGSKNSLSPTSKFVQWGERLFALYFTPEMVSKLYARGIQSLNFEGMSTEDPSHGGRLLYDHICVTLMMMRGSKLDEPPKHISGVELNAITKEFGIPSAEQWLMTKEQCQEFIDFVDINKRILDKVLVNQWLVEHGFPIFETPETALEGFVIRTESSTFKLKVAPYQAALVLRNALSKDTGYENVLSTVNHFIKKWGYSREEGAVIRGKLMEGYKQGKDIPRFPGLHNGILELLSNHTTPLYDDVEGPIIYILTGRPGSGKSTFTEHLRKEYPDLFEHACLDADKPFGFKVSGASKNLHLMALLFGIICRYGYAIWSSAPKLLEMEMANLKRAFPGLKVVEISLDDCKVDYKELAKHRGEDPKQMECIYKKVWEANSKVEFDAEMSKKEFLTKIEGLKPTRIVPTGATGIGVELFVSEDLTVWHRTVNYNAHIGTDEAKFSPDRFETKLVTATDKSKGRGKKERIGGIKLPTGGHLTIPDFSSKNRKPKDTVEILETIEKIAQDETLTVEKSIVTLTSLGLFLVPQQRSVPTTAFDYSILGL